MIKKYGLKCDDQLQLEKFTINLGSIMSHLTDVICSETKGGYMLLGQVINLHRLVRVTDVQSWVMMM